MVQTWLLPLFGAGSGPWVILHLLEQTSPCNQNKNNSSLLLQFLWRCFPLGWCQPLPNTLNIPYLAVQSTAQRRKHPPNIPKAGAGGSLFVLVLVLLQFNICSYGLVLYGCGILFQDSIL